MDVWNEVMTTQLKFICRKVGFFAQCPGLMKNLFQIKEYTSKMFLWTRGMQFCHSRRNVSHKTAKRFHSVTPKVEKKILSAEKKILSVSMDMQNASLTNLLKIIPQKVYFWGSLPENWKKKMIFRKQNFYCSKCPDRDKECSSAIPA